jgi:hypothetical protein
MNVWPIDARISFHDNMVPADRGVLTFKAPDLGRQRVAVKAELWDDGTLTGAPG